MAFIVVCAFKFTIDHGDRHHYKWERERERARERIQSILSAWQNQIRMNNGSKTKTNQNEDWCVRARASDETWKIDKFALCQLFDLPDRYANIVNRKRISIEKEVKRAVTVSLFLCNFQCARKEAKCYAADSLVLCLDEFPIQKFPIDF